MSRSTNPYFQQTDGTSKMVQQQPSVPYDYSGGNQSVQPISQQHNHNVYQPQQVVQQPVVQQPVVYTNVIQQPLIGQGYQNSSNLGYAQSQFVCEVDPNHRNIQAGSKCSFCSKMMCLRCSTTVQRRYGGRRWAYRVATQSCNPCATNYRAIQAKQMPIYYIVLILTIIGSLGLFPVSGVLGVAILIYACTLPNDLMHSFFRRSYIIYGITNIALAIFYCAILVVMISIFATGY